MEEKSDCEHCKTWEEEMYWKHFNSMHFWQILPKDFHDHLVLPEKFSVHMTSQLPDKVSLIGPSGSVWDVQLQKSEKSENLLLVGDGWKQFAETYELEENCLLMFKYTRNSSIEVLIFDRESFCEKESAYFVKTCRHSSKSELENHENRNVRDQGLRTEVSEDDEEDGDSVFVVRKKSKKDAEGEAVCLGQKNTRNPRNHTPIAATIGRCRRRKMATPCNSLRGLQADSKEKHGINEANEELSQISLRDMTPPENGESSPEKHHSDKLKDQSEKNPSGNDTIQELSPISGRDQSTPEDGEDCLEMNHFHKMKSPPGKEAGETDTASPVTSRELITLDDIESIPVAHHSPQPIRKRGRPKKQAVPNSSRKPVSRSVSAGKGHVEEYMSERRAVTEMEKEEALQRAKQEQTDNSFIAVMRPTCVYKRFFLSIPAEWINKHLALKHQGVVLRMGNKTWLTGFYYHSKRRVGGICPGWKKFVLDNSLEEFDVLLFKLDTPKDDATIIFDVEIFRVIPKILPPLLANSTILA